VLEIFEHSLQNTRPYTIVYRHRRGGRAVECTGLENLFVLFM